MFAAKPEAFVLVEGHCRTARSYDDATYEHQNNGKGRAARDDCSDSETGQRTILPQRALCR